MKKDLVPGGKGDKTNLNSLDKNELKVGIAVEMEHTNDKKKALEIAIDHLTENPKYYSKLINSGLVDEKPALELAKKLGMMENKMKVSEFRKLIREEIKKILKEGHDGNIGPFYQKVKSQQDAMKVAKSMIDNDADLKYFRGVKWVGDTSEDRLDKLANKFEDDYIIVGKVNGEYWNAYWRRS